MAESTLTLKRDTYLAKIGSFLGYGRDPSQWTPEVSAEIDLIVNSGIARVYAPPRLPGESVAYSWSFMTPVATIAWTPGVQAVPLPDDFGGFEGRAILSSQFNQVSWPVPIVGIGMVNQQYAQIPVTTGRPCYAAIDWLKGTGPTQGQRAQLKIWPQADANYNLLVQYFIIPDALTGDRPFLYGNGLHSELFLESCLAIAEQHLDDSMSIHTAAFMERLAASIDLDRKSKPQTLLYNADRSDAIHGSGYGWQYLHGFSRVLVNGVQY